MTLNTMLVLHEWTDPVELHTWFNKHVLKVADRNPIITETATSIGNDCGQGFDAIFDVRWREDHGPIVWFDVDAERSLNLRHVPDIYPTEQDAIDEADETADLYADYPSGVIKINWDTAYGYSGPGGVGCTELHARFIIRLAKEYLEPRGITFAWQNEYSGEWHEGLTGFEDFGQNGREADEWFRTVARPAIEAQIASEVRS